MNNLLQHLLLVQPKGARKIAHARLQHRISEQIRPARDELALEIPAEDAAVAGIARARDDVVLALLLQRDHARQELGVVAEIRVHDDDEVARSELQAVHVRGSQAQFAGAGLQFDVFGPDCRDQLFGDVLRAVGGAVVDDNYFPVEVAGVVGLVLVLEGERCGMLDILFFECLLEEPDDDGKVAAFIVGGEDDGVFVPDGHVGQLSGR